MVDYGTFKKQSLNNKRHSQKNKKNTDIKTQTFDLIHPVSNRRTYAPFLLTQLAAEAVCHNFQDGYSEQFVVITTIGVHVYMCGPLHIHVCCHVGQSIYESSYRG